MPETPNDRRALAQVILPCLVAAGMTVGIIANAADGAALLPSILGVIALAAWVVRALTHHPNTPFDLALILVMVVCGSLSAPGTQFLGFAGAIAGTMTALSQIERPWWQGISAVTMAFAITLGLGVIGESPIELVLGCTGTLALTTLFALLRRQSRTLVRAQRQALVDQVAASQARADTAASEERARIARDLHDILAHTLGGLTLQLDAVDAELEAGAIEAAQDRVRSAHSLAARGLDEAREAVASLRAAPTALPRALAYLVDQHRELGGAATLQIADLGEVSPEVADALAAACREALTNARRHAPGSATTVTVARSGSARDTAPDASSATAPTPQTSGRLVLRASTAHAPGVHSASVGGGHGLTGMRERIERLGGSLRVVDGAAFSLEIEVPV